MEIIMSKYKIKDEEKVIFVKWVTRKGKKIYAYQYGLKAFPIVVKA